jgi:hypothetical protein
VLKIASLLVIGFVGYLSFLFVPEAVKDSMVLAVDRNVEIQLAHFTR